MNNIIYSAGAGFAAGLAIGLNSKYQSLEDNLELLDAFPKEAREKAGMNDEQMASTKKANKRMKYFMPLSLGYIGGFASTVISSGNLHLDQLGENVAVSIPFAYLGAYTGRIINRVKNRKRRKENKERIKEVRIYKQIIEDLEHTEQYLPESIRQTHDGALSKIEQMILAGEDPTKDPEYARSLSQMYDSVTKPATVYSQFALAWSVKKTEETIERAVLQREMTQFFEKPHEFSFGILGEPKNDKMRIFARQGQEYAVYTLDLSPPNQMEHPSELICEKKQPWTGDYRQIAQEALAEKQRTITTMKCPSNPPAPFVAVTAMMKYKAQQDQTRQEKFEKAMEN